MKTEKPVTAFYMQGRQRNRLHSMLVESARSAYGKDASFDFIVKDLAKKLGRRPSTLRKWLGHPAYVTFNAVSDVLYAMDMELAAEPRQIPYRKPQNALTYRAQSFQRSGAAGPSHNP